MDAMKIKPNVSFPFTVINGKNFIKTDASKIFKSNMYNIPDYWFPDESLMIEFTGKLKTSPDFIDYFFENLKGSIKKYLESTIIMTLRTNSNIIFVKIDSEGYKTTLDNLIELNVALERYEECKELLEFKNKIVDEFRPMIGKSLYYEAYEFWKPVYPNHL